MPTNRLAGETSPYLLQHAHNPVDWHPWGAEALERARAEDRPIFLSIGYAACHWCHVMERESFEDLGTATYLNANFVSIKVDREERPDLDAIYMQAVQALTGSGGWPMSVFLTPSGEPFYGGTYFPNTRRHGLPAFRDVLEGVARGWRERRPDVERAGAGLTARLAATVRLGDHAAPARADVLDSAVGALAAGFDGENGGWGTPMKFPQPMALEFLLRRAVAGDDRALRLARPTLDAMAAGGIHDQLGGGFSRYATEPSWLVPHFEKMLSDNAQLARVYLHAWQLTRDTAYLAVARSTPRLRGARDDAARRRLRGEPRRGHGRRGGRDVHVDGERGSQRARRRGPCRGRGARRGGVRRHAGRQLGGAHHPPARRHGCCACDANRAGGCGGQRAAGRGACRAPGGPRFTAAADPRRQGARGLERAHARGIRGCGRDPGADARCITRGRGTPLSRHRRAGRGSAPRGAGG